MQKIPTLFVRDPEDMSQLTQEVHPDCQWVLDGEGIATRKYDGTCVFKDMVGRWWSRREVKFDADPPNGFWSVEADANTGKVVGYEPIEQSSFYKFFVEAFDRMQYYKPGATFELCGPKINSNPENFETHTLVPHHEAEIIEMPADISYDSLRELMLSLKEEHGYEGVVWRHPDGRMAKLKAKDFR